MLRPYQLKAVESAEREFLRVNSTLIVMATGTGKTCVLSEITRREVSRGGRVLILAHRGELLEQAIDKLYKFTGIKAALEKADSTSEVESDEPPFTVIVGSLQSMCRPDRLKRFSRNEFSLVITDEAHHSISDTYKTIYAYFSNAKLLGVTATPDRGDLRDLSEVFQTISFEYSIVEAIRDGYLSPINAQTIPLKIDLRGVAKQAGDYQAAGLGAALIPYLHQICREIKQRCADRKTIVFTPLISISREMVEIFKAEGVENIREVNGESADRAETLEWFANAPKGCVLCNSMLLCLDDKTEILTDKGWVGMNDISMAHKVANWNFDGSVFFETPKEIVKRPLEKDREHMVTIKSSRCDIRVTSTHRMIVACGENGNKWKKIPANEIRKGHSIPTYGIAAPFDLKVEQENRPQGKYQISQYSYNIRRSNPSLSLEESKRIASKRIAQRNSLKRKDPSELTLDECRFIGFWLADGSVCNLLTGGVEYTLAQSFAYPHIIKWIDKLLERLGYDYRRRIKPPPSKNNKQSVLWSLPRGTGWGCQKRNGVYKIESYLIKDGTDLFWGLNTEQFSALVEGFWYGDGNHLDAKNGCGKSIYISNTNKKIIDLISAIGSVRGWRCRISPIPQKNTKHKTQYGLRMINGAEKFTITNKTKIKHEPFNPETVWCVRTTSKNIITRRNGRVAVMGNTEGYDEPSVDCIVILRATKVRALYVQMVGRGTRLCEGKKNLLLLDFLWLTSTHDLCRPAHLLSNNENICKMITKKQEKKAGTEEIEITPELIEETESEFTKKCKDTLAKKLEAQSRKKGKLFDALQFAELTGIVELKNVSNKLDETDRPTMEQFDQLEKLGFACPGSAKGAEELLTAYQNRVNSGLTTAKQIRFLSSRGFQNVNKWKQTDAEKLIRRIAACGWSRLPHGINPATYTP